MRFFFAAAMVVFLAGPAFAQQAPVQPYGEADKDKTQEQIRGEKAAERAYKNSLSNIPDKGPTDPWGAVRSNDAPKTSAGPSAAKTSAAKTSAAKAKTKTGTAN
jgi:hypothetical protein